jgi:hypothetical protein
MSSCYEVIHTRWILFVANEYWIIYDRLRGDSPHCFDLRFHLSPEAWDRTKLWSAATVCAPGFALVFNPGYKISIEPGWVAPQYGTKLPAPVVSLAAKGVKSADFFTVVAPIRSTDHIPTLDVRHDRSGASDALCVEVCGVGPNRSARDLVAWSPSITHFDVAPFQCWASAAWIRTSSLEKTPSFLACNVQELRWTSSGKREFFAAMQPSPWISWDEPHGLVENGQRPDSQGSGQYMVARTLRTGDGR